VCEKRKKTEVFEAIGGGGGGTHISAAEQYENYRTFFGDDTFFHNYNITYTCTVIIIIIIIIIIAVLFSLFCRRAA